MLVVIWLKFEGNIWNGSVLHIVYGNEKYVASIDTVLKLNVIKNNISSRGSKWIWYLLMALPRCKGKGGVKRNKKVYCKIFFWKRLWTPVTCVFYFISSKYYHCLVNQQNQKNMTTWNMQKSKFSGQFVRFRSMINDAVVQ